MRACVYVCLIEKRVAVGYGNKGEMFRAEIIIIQIDNFHTTTKIFVVLRGNRTLWKSQKFQVQSDHTILFYSSKYFKHLPVNFV